jgi:hypothetical protein
LIDRHSYLLLTKGYSGSGGQNEDEFADDPAAALGDEDTLDI